MEKSQIAKLIDHTLLKPDATREQIVRLAEEAKKYDFASVCVNPCWIPLAKELLLECGYRCGNVNACLARLIFRLRTEEDFPHEVGLFLGYPPADVDGFMHRKKEYKCSGLWKVYDDVEGAMRQFAKCRHCTEVCLNCLSHGFSLDRLAVAG